jgi:hypothetical protein
MAGTRRGTNNWRPLTCDCVVEFEFFTDANDDPIESTMKIFAVHRTCTRHTATPFQINSHPLNVTVNRPRRDQKLHNDTVLELIARLTGNATYTGTDAGGNVFLKDTAIAWAFDGAGVLVLTFTPSLSGALRTTIQNAIDAKVGAGQVRVA